MFDQRTYGDVSLCLHTAGLVYVFVCILYSEISPWCELGLLTLKYIFF